MSADAYLPRRPAQSSMVAVRELQVHVLQWGSAEMASPERPPLVLLHGFMDVGASFQFMVDALAEIEGPVRWIVACDLRGFGRTFVPDRQGAVDAYWPPDYLGDLDGLLNTLMPQALPQGAVDLLGHSMGGNVAMSYAGLRPARIRRLVNLEGFGLPETQPEEAPQRLRRWLDELQAPASLRSYDSMHAVAERLLHNNPLLTPDKAAWLAPHWAQPRADGRWHVLGDPAHKRVNPLLYRKQEIVATWALIEAPLLWVEGDMTDTARWWGDRYPRSDFEARLAVVPQLRKVLLSPCGHMLHHDQPQALARHLADFLH